MGEEGLVVSEIVSGKSYKQRVSALSRELAQDMFQSARLFFERGDFKQAEKLYADVLEHDPYHFDAVYHRGMIARRLRNFLDAEKFTSPSVNRACSFINRLQN